MRSLVALAVRRRVTINMIVLMFVVFGAVGYSRLNLDLLPDIDYPSLTVRTEFPNTAPPEIETLVTRPVEEAVGVLRGLERMHSVSRSGLSEVTLAFRWDTDLDAVSLDVREKLDRLTLPDEAEPPIVLRFDPSLDPILRLAVMPPGGIEDARRLVEKRTKTSLETIQGVAAADVMGGLEEEIQIDLDQERMTALGLTLEEVRSLVSTSNVNLPGGALEDVDNRYLIRTINEFDSVEEISQLVVRRRGDSIVRLGDVADVRLGSPDREEITRVDGRECVEIAVFKEGDDNTVQVAKRVRGALEELERELPEGYRMQVLFDQSRFIEQAVGEVRSALVVGGMLAVLVLLAFLRDARSTLIIATSIPVSVITAFVFMYRFDVSLNIMSLGGLTLGIGMLVDNAIVVLESIFRHRRTAPTPARAAIDGTSEVAGAVVAATLTTVAVFLPIVFVEGIAGQLFGDMALTVTLSLLASLAIALTLIPMLSSLGGRPADRADAAPRDPATPPGRDAGAVASLGAFSRGYDRVLRGALRHRWATLGVAVVLLGLAMFGLSRVDTELVPAISEGEIAFEVTLPEGTALAKTDRTIQHAEAALAGDPRVDRYYVRVGSRLVTGGMALNPKAEHLGQLNVVLADRRDETAQAAIADVVRSRFAAIPDAQAREGRPSYFTLETPIEVVLFGDDLDALRAAGDAIAADMRAAGIFVDVRSSMEEGFPELQIVFDRDRLAALGLTTRELSETLRDRVEGDVATRFREADRQIDVRIRNRLQDRDTRNDVANLVVPGPDGAAVRLVTIADIVESRGPAEIHRISQQRAAVITSNLDGVGLGEAVTRLESILAGAALPVDVTSEIAGQNREMKVSFASLRFAIGLAIFLVYLVMAATFESLVHPFVVLFTVPFALIGVAVGLVVTQTPISVIVLIGAIMLVGIVVNNAIVLIDRVNQLRRAGVDKTDAIVRGAHVRLRPILMTTATTVLGLVPMALTFGQGAELRSPLAITVAFGLTFGTGLTLIVIPVVYAIVPAGAGRTETGA